MPDPWAPDIEVDSALAARLIQGRFPQLGRIRLEPLGVGWDNAAFLVNGAYVFRFPRRKIAANLIEREARILPLLAPSLPVRIPEPAFVCRAAGEYPWTFAGYPLIPGETADRISLNDGDRNNLCPALAAFLSALHKIPIDQSTRLWAPGDELRRADISFRAHQVIANLERIRAPANSNQIASALTFIHELIQHLNTQHPTPTWVHGDLYARHLLVNDSRNFKGVIDWEDLAGIIDWGDVHIGDPALDLSIAFSFLPPASRSAFRAMYGSVDNHTWDRARFRALHYAPILIEYGASVGDSGIMQAGHIALRYASQV